MRGVTVFGTILSFFVTLTTMPAMAAADDTIANVGDPDKGRRLFVRCQTCHNLTSTARTKLGPNLDDLFGKTAGTSESYARYSDAMKNSEIIWDDKTLDQWLANPRVMIPGNKMVFPGLRSEKDRQDIIAYLREATIGQ